MKFLKFLLKRHCFWMALLPFALYYAGIGLNVLVVTANYGVMPFYGPSDADPLHVVMDHHTHLKFLCDWINVYWAGAIMSPGDVLMEFGEWLEPVGIGAWLALYSTNRY